MQFNLEENQTTDSLTEFINLLLKRELDGIDRKIVILQNLCMLIKKSLNPSVVSFKLYDQGTQFLTPLYICEGKITKDKLEFELDAFDEENPYSNLFTATNAIWESVSNISNHFELKKTLEKEGITEIIMAPIILEENKIVGVLSIFLYKETIKYNEENYLDIINEISNIIAISLSSWFEEHTLKLKHQQTDLIVEMSNLTLETTELQLILKSILPKIKGRTDVEGIGVFIKDINRFTLIQQLGLSQEIENYYSSPDLEISNLNYYNASNVINEIEFEQEQYGLILPIGSTNLMLGFLFVISSTQEKLSESNIHFLRIVSNQLFLTLQRKRLLDDIQQITQTSEFSSFPVILVNNRFEIIYLNKQAENIFNISHDEMVGLKLDYVLKLEKDSSASIQQKTKEVIANIAKDSMKLDIEVFQIGKKDMRTFFVQMAPTINNLTGEYCVVLSLVDISEATKLQSIAEEYSNRSRMYLNVLTHDIYNILFGISGYYELLSDKIPREQKEIIDRVSKLVRRGTSIVQDIRLLSNVLDISIGAELNFIPLKMTLTTVIEKVVEEFFDTKIETDVNIPNYVKVVGGSFLHDMFLYVLTSLLHKTTKEEVSIEISGKEVSVEKDPYYEVKIYDKEGSPPEIKEEIQRALDLSPFDETVRKHLGFMIVNEIAKKYNYMVDLEDADEMDWRKGSFIKILMPLSVEEEKEKQENLS